MKCDNCGRKIKRGYEWKGQILGSACFKKIAWDNDPALALLKAAKAILSNDNSFPISAQWKRILGDSHRQREAKIRAQALPGSHAWWLALLTRNVLARYRAPCSIDELEKYR